MISLNNYCYNLPEKLIAGYPSKPRTKSRFLVYNSKNQTLKDSIFENLKRELKKGDLIVINNTKVFPARLIGEKETKGKVEVLLLEQVGKNWKCLIRGKVEKKQKLYFRSEIVGLKKLKDTISSNKKTLLLAEIVSKNQKEAIIKFNKSGEKLFHILYQIGKTPIPPYIKNSPLAEDNLKTSYQTVYAKKGFSSAAPTAGLHFSTRQVSQLKKSGICFAEICLNVGLGTFLPLTKNNIKNKKLHFENFTIPYSAIKKIQLAKKQKNKIVAVGTTTVRALETVSAPLLKLKKSYSGSTSLFIQPGFKFKIIDMLITNFHLPKSSLMILISAFLKHKGIENSDKELLKVYNYAIKKEYRFYSFGDSMMIK